MPRKKPAVKKVLIESDEKGVRLVQKIATIKVIKKYYDTLHRCEMPIGEGFECTEKRAKELVNAKVAEIIKIVCLKN